MLTILTNGGIEPPASFAFFTRGFGYLNFKAFNFSALIYPALYGVCQFGH